MATFIQTDSVGGNTTGNAIIQDAQYGIDAVLDGYIIQSVSVSKARTFDETYDQKNALISELDTDEQWSLSMTVIGGNGDEDATLDKIDVGDTAFTWNGKKWKVRDVTYNGTYNDKKSYTISAFRSANFPAQS